jgi:formate transporter
MYFIPIGLLIKMDAPFLDLIGKNAADYASLTWMNFFTVNLLSVTIGNVIGGVLLVGFVYWFIYLRPGSLPAIRQITGVTTSPSVTEKK